MADVPDTAGFILTKIIATLGPATSQIKTIMRLIEEGARIFRINFSHGNLEQFERLLARVRQASEVAGVPIGVLGDLSGPKIRVGAVRDEGVDLEAGSAVAFIGRPIVAEPPAAGAMTTFSINLPEVLKDIKVGQRVLIDDGAIRMLAVEKSGTGSDECLVCQIIVGGRVLSAKGVNLPDSDLKLPSLTGYDLRCIDWAVKFGIDFLGLSFVRRAEDIRSLRAQLSGTGQQAIPVIAKIEKPQALEDLESIVHETDGVMVARGDLGVEMDLAAVPIAQKRIIGLAHSHGKPVIVATQMLQSMIDHPTPTRAEVSDVANAIYDGADAVMLSGETAVGKFPIQAVAMMARVVRITIEQFLQDRTRVAHPPGATLNEGRYRTAALARAVVGVVEDLDAKLVVTWSQRGGGALYLSKNRLNVPVLAASSEPEPLRRMTLLYGVVPVAMPMPAGREAFAAEMDRIIQERGWARPGDPIVLVAGKPLGVSGVTNTLWVRYIGDE